MNVVKHFKVVVYRREHTNNFRCIVDSDIQTMLCFNKGLILFKDYRFHNVSQSSLPHKYTWTHSVNYYTWLRFDTGYLSIHRYLYNVHNNILNIQNNSLVCTFCCFVYYNKRISNHNKNKTQTNIYISHNMLLVYILNKHAKQVN